MILETLKASPPTKRVAPSCSQDLASVAGDELEVVEETFKRESRVSSRASLRIPKEINNEKQLLLM